MNNQPAIPSLVLIPGETKDDFATLYAVASAYAHSGLIVSEEAKHSDQPVLAFPAIVCSSFAIELFLKFFIALEKSEDVSLKSKTTGHLLPLLWREISLPRQKIIAGMYQNSSIEPDLNASETRLKIFSDALERIGEKPFIKWRYIHEITSTEYMSHAAIGVVTEALRAAATYCMKQKLPQQESKDSEESMKSEMEDPLETPNKSTARTQSKKLLFSRSGNLALIQGHEPILLGRPSFLRRIPISLERKQAHFFDGIRYTVEFIDVAYSRLYEVLTQLALHPPTTNEIPARFSEIFLDAWNIVYCVNQFQAMYSQFPGITFAAPKPGTPTFEEHTKGFREIRKAADNFSKKSDLVISDGGNAIGEINWITGQNIQPAIVAWHCTMRGGTFHALPSQSTEIFESTLGWPTDGITLSLGKSKANLSAIRKYILTRIISLESQLETEFSKPEHNGVGIANDFFARRSVKFQKN